MIIYKTTNLINNKIYIGKDSNNNTEYFGSGLILNYAINKYGIENFIKETLQTCKTNAELNDAEIYWINKLNSTDKTIGYNIALGGKGGDTYTNNPNLDNIRLKFIGSKNPFYGKKHSTEVLKIISDTHKGKIPWNKGKTEIYTKETITKMSESSSGMRLNIDLEELKNIFEINNMSKVKTERHFGISKNTLNSRLNLIYGRNTNLKKGEQ